MVHDEPSAVAYTRRAARSLRIRRNDPADDEPSAAAPTRRAASPRTRSNESAYGELRGVASTRRAARSPSGGAASAASPSGGAALVRAKTCHVAAAEEQLSDGAPKVHVVSPSGGTVPAASPSGGAAMGRAKTSYAGAVERQTSCEAPKVHVASPSGGAAPAESVKSPRGGVHHRDEVQPGTTTSSSSGSSSGSSSSSSGATHRQAGGETGRPSPASPRRCHQDGVATGCCHDGATLMWGTQSVTVASRRQSPRCAVSHLDEMQSVSDHEVAVTPSHERRSL